MSENIHAFPQFAAVDHHGMSLRDYFAGQVVAGFMGNPKIELSPLEIAEYCYLISDYMLKIREDDQ